MEAEPLGEAGHRVGRVLHPMLHLGRQFLTSRPKRNLGRMRGKHKRVLPLLRQPITRDSAPLLWRGTLARCSLHLTQR